MPEALLPAIAPAESWLEAIDSDSPILLIAPHGGRAEPRTRSMLNPKVNDLHTADITRDLAARLGASALINSAMDRNRLDCNRIAQIVERAPWLLELIADRIGAIVTRHGRAVVLLVHGWNIIEPRVDFGLGLRTIAGELRPAGAACVSASDDFINGPLTHLAESLVQHGIKPTYGMRYPGGGLQNLLQAFTARHRESQVASLRAISDIAATGAIEAAQLELSVALRMPGELRARCEDALAATFSLASNGTSVATSRKAIVVNRAPREAIPKRDAAPSAGPASTRVGIEFYDPSARIGAMASFDVGQGGIGARIMVLFDRNRVGLFTAEGRPARSETDVRHGPLSLTRDGNSILLAFRGPAVIVPDATAYLSIERALASGRLDGSMEVGVRLDLPDGEFDFARILTPNQPADNAPNAIAAFGRAAGTVRINGASRQVGGYARAGISFTGLGPQNFVTRRMIWACFDDDDAPSALEVRSIASADPEPHRSARAMLANRWRQCDLRDLIIDTDAVEEPPHIVAASIAYPDGRTFTFDGRAECFIPLSRPGPDQSRIYTSLGFASFQSGTKRGAGMFEFSRRADSVLTNLDETDDSDSE
ncbi:MAG: hypothetical protein Q7S58_17540 [Candidatus Binatus sp.]|uniref:hypothetical protein n=1 Tax=Candidatus Binatus sp. TaxID=2811406 RepID=UPI0027257295|nr:hypothetical protein [Candidatus Binatus sp.]MDO8434206.1 hypothetical protein [Candidatus Binatus sp.]